jgi:PKD repeat protein
MSSLLTSTVSTATPSPISAPPTGANFNHIVIIAMENQPEEILGTSSTPFLNSLMAAGSTLAQDNHYPDNVNCSAGCYVEFTTGAANGDGIGDGWSCCAALTSVVDQIASAGLTWQVYCGEGCPRGLDHFPFAGYSDLQSSTNIFGYGSGPNGGVSVSTSTFINEANSANPPNYLWYTPTDSENMHDNSISSGDSYLQSFLVGSGTVSSPASGSLLASNLFTNPSDRTLLFIWFDECGESDGAGYNCDSNSNTANVEYGPGVVKAGYTSQSSYNEFSELAMIEDNWGLSVLGSAASNTAVNDIFSSTQPLPLSASYTYTPSVPVAGTPIVFIGLANGGTPPYSYAWSFGDGGSSIGQSPGHTYANSGTYTATLRITDSLGTLATVSQSINVASRAALTASFSIAPTSPVSGQTVTFTAAASGGTSPYSYSWNLGETTSTGNPVSQSFTNGSYTITLTVTDGAGKTATSSQSLTVMPSSTVAGSVPTLIGWGGVRMDESVAGTSGTMSAVFPGEHASDMELLLIHLKSMGYNTVRVEFDPYCTDTSDYNYMSVYSQTNAQRAVEIAQHYGFWIILDYHGFSDVFRNTSCWVSYWKPIVQNIGPSYSQIIWEPENEPTLDCSNSPSSCPAAPCSSDASCVTYLSNAYQQWINQTRLLGDTHWIVVQNLCSYACGFSDMSQGYPTVTDPLGTLSQGGRIFISLHSYMDYGSYSGQWANATADSLAQQYYQAVLSGVSTTGWPALNTEGGTDPLCPGTCAPDTVLSGSAGYTVVTFHFIQALVNLYDTNSPQRINWVWWPVGSWTNTAGAGIYGAVQCSGNPVGWGCLLNTVPVATGSSFGLTTSTTTVSIMQTFSQKVTVTLASLSGFTGTVDFTTVVNGTGVSAKLSSQSQYLSSGSILSITLSITTTNSTSLGNYQVTVTATDGTVSRSISIPLRVNMLGDILGTGIVNIVDLGIISYAYGSTPSSPNWNPLADLNHDGVVNVVDFEMAVANFDK